MGPADAQRAAGARLEPGRCDQGDARPRSGRPRTHAQVELPSTSSLLRQYKRWEAGEVEPDRGKAELFYKPIIAKMFGTVTHAMFPVRAQA